MGELVAVGSTLDPVRPVDDFGVGVSKPKVLRSEGYDYSMMTILIKICIKMSLNSSIDESITVSILRWE